MLPVSAGTIIYIGDFKVSYFVFFLYFVPDIFILSLEMAVPVYHI